MTAADLPASRDLSLIFERDDVREAFAGHCAKTHDLNDPLFMRDCEYCNRLVTILAFAIGVWLAEGAADDVRRICRACGGTGDGVRDPIEGTLMCESCMGSGFLTGAADDRP